MHASRQMQTGEIRHLQRMLAYEDAFLHRAEDSCRGSWVHYNKYAPIRHLLPIAVSERGGISRGR
jgi:hypothetical protein